MKKIGKQKFGKVLLMTIFSVIMMLSISLNASAAGLAVATGDPGVSPVWWIVFGVAAALIIAVIVTFLIKKRQGK